MCRLNYTVIPLAHVKIISPLILNRAPKRVFRGVKLVLVSARIEHCVGLTRA